MELKIILISIYLIIIVLAQILIEKRLKTIYLRHHEKIGGGYGTYGIFLLYKRMMIILRIGIIILFFATSAIIITLL